MVHASDGDRSMLPWHDPRNSQHGLNVGTPGAALAAEQAAPQEAPTHMLRGTAAELRRRMGTDTQADPVYRRPNLRGALAKAQAKAKAISTPVREGEWSATAEPTPALTEPVQEAQGGLTASSPTASVTIPDRL